MRPVTAMLAQALGNAAAACTTAAPNAALVASAFGGIPFAARVRASTVAAAG